MGALDQIVRSGKALERIEISCPGEVALPRLGLRLICRPATQIVNTSTVFTVMPQGTLWLRSRESGDEMRLAGGSKSLKKLFIDRKIPASQRPEIPVLADEQGVLGVYGIGANLDRIPMQLPAVQLAFEKE